MQSREAFEGTTAAGFAGERELVGIFKSAHEALDDLGSDELSNRYFNLLKELIDKFSLRYDLRRPCTLCPTLPGVFASLVRDLLALTSQDPHLDTLMKEFENAVRDLRHDCPDGRIKTCIQKQLNLVEAIGRSYLTGFTPYLESRPCAAAIFGCSANHAGTVAPVAALAIGSVDTPVAIARPEGFLSHLAFWKRER